MSAPATQDGLPQGVEIQVREERLVLLPDKAVWWRDQSTLFVADTHFGKTATFRALGIPAPDNTAEDLTRLDALLRETASRRLVVLGDFWHSIKGRSEEVMHLLDAWRKRQDALEWVVVLGNHDRGAGTFPPHWRIEVTDSWKKENSPFRGEHHPSAHAQDYVLCGHIHPSLTLTDRHGGSLRSPCFVVGETRTILPAFGSFTGTETWHPEGQDRLFAIGPGQVVEIPRPRRRL